MGLHPGFQGLRAPNSTTPTVGAKARLTRRHGLVFVLFLEDMHRHRVTGLSAQLCFLLQMNPNAGFGFS